MEHKTLEKILFESRNSNYWGGSSHIPKKFDELVDIFITLEPDTLKIYLDELAYEYYKLQWNDNDSDVGVYDVPDIIVAKQAIMFLVEKLEQIPKGKRKMAFNFVINSASCGRGWVKKGSQEDILQMKKRMNHCFVVCKALNFDPKMTNKYSSLNLNLWNSPFDSNRVEKIRNS